MPSAGYGMTSTAVSGPENRYNIVYNAHRSDTRGGFGDIAVSQLVRITRLSLVFQSLQSAREIHQFNHDIDELKGWMAEKEAVLDSEDQDLHSIQTLLTQHEALEVEIIQQDTWA